MTPVNISVVRSDESYGYAQYYYYEGPTVYIEITGINSSNSKWRVRGRNSLGDDRVYLEDQGLGVFSFESDDNMSYIFQIQNWNGTWVNTSNLSDQSENSIIYVTFDHDSGDDGDDSGGEPEVSDYQIYIYEGDGTSLDVERTWNEYTGESYDGKMSNGTKIHWKDRFCVLVKPLTGYQNAKATFINYNITKEVQNDDGSISYYGTMSEAGNISIISGATLIDNNNNPNSKKGFYIGIDNIARKIKKGYIGINSINIKITNILPAIDGNKGFSNGSSSTTHTKYASSSLMLTGSTDADEVCAVTTETYQLNPDHIYYIRVEVYQEKVIGQTSLYWPISEPNFYSKKTAAAGTWSIISAVNNRSSFTSGSYPLRLDFDNKNNTGYMWFDGLMLIDLTEDFGAGKEPSVEWCDINIPYFIGVRNIEIPSITSVARKIKKAYIGVGGVARPCWFEGKIGYYGYANGLSNPVIGAAATHIGDYALFAGGVYNYLSNYSSTIDGYDALLTKYPQINTLSEGRYLLVATHNNKYAIFAGGFKENGTESGVVDAYDTSLSKISVASFDGPPASSAHIGQYAVFFGVTDGYYSVCTYAYDSSLTQVYAGLDGEIPALAPGQKEAAASTPYGAFAVSGNELHVFDSSLSRKLISTVFTESEISGTSVGDYAVFAGGRSNNSCVSTMRYVDKSFTVNIGTSMGIARGDLAATHVADYAIFAFGITSIDNVKIGRYADFYDAKLTRTFEIDSSSNIQNRVWPKCTHIGNYALFASGGSRSNIYGITEDSTVNVYTVR